MYVKLGQSASDSSPSNLNSVLGTSAQNLAQEHWPQQHQSQVSHCPEIFPSLFWIRMLLQ